MSPKAIRYKANSIIFFKGDRSDKIFILNSGKVSLNYLDIETGQEIHDPIKTGEFFGVKSALGRFPREETALVLQDSNVIAFSIPEFEQVVTQNTRIILKMLKVFSNQLRRIHKRVQNLLYSEVAVKPETGLYKIGEYYLKNKRYSQALYAYKRYLVYYPSGAYADDVTRKIELTEECLSKYDQGKGAPQAPVSTGGTVAFEKPAQKKEMSDVAKSFYNAISLVSQQKYQEAFSEFKTIADNKQDEEYVAKAHFEIGRCLFHLEQYDKCIQSFTGLVQSYPKHPDLREALFFVGNCYDRKGEKNRASGFYKKILSMETQESPLYRKTRKALRAIEGG